MLPKGQRHRSVRAEYRATRGVEPAAPPIIPTVDLDLYDQASEGGGTPVHTITAPAEARGLRLDQYLAQAIPEISRSRVQLLIDHGQVMVDGAPAKPRHKVTPGEQIVISGSPRPAPLQATPEAIALDIVYEDKHLAIINKPAGMAVHAGAAAPAADDPDATDAAAAEDEDSAGKPDPRSSGTLVNALLHHFNHSLSQVAGELRPGIVHRLDKQTSGLIVVAKDDPTHRRLSEHFAAREVHKTYLALVHGHIARADTTVTLPIGRDLVRRIRMTTRRPADSPGVRSAVSHVHVLERLSTPFGPFTLVEVTIETGRTHQIRVHLQALGHPVVGDTTYGAPHLIRSLANPAAEPLSLARNFLHAARLSFPHPRTGKPLHAEAPLPAELTSLLAALSGTPLESTS
jgi:23S rRNA pseudouridine1911/1915/1917 synthase